MALGLLYALMLFSAQVIPKSGMAVSIYRISRDMSSGIFSPFVEQVEMSPQVHCTRTIGGSLTRIQTKKQVALTCELGGSLGAYYSTGEYAYCEIPDLYNLYCFVLRICALLSYSYDGLMT